MSEAVRRRRRPTAAPASGVPRVQLAKQRSKGVDDLHVPGGVPVLESTVEADHGRGWVRVRRGRVEPGRGEPQHGGESVVPGDTGDSGS